MKKFSTLVLLLVVCGNIFGQSVTITDADMPVSGINYQYNISPNNIQFTASQTGDGYTWDFTNLQANSQTTDSFMAVLQTPLVYNIAFNLPFDPERATVANNLSPLPSFGNIPLPIPVTFSDKNSFYRTESGVFKQVGFAFTADYNGTQIPLPVKYTDMDEIYALPINFGQTQPTTTARYEFQIPNLVTYIENSSRTNTIDGQGTLKLPNGDFEALRVKSMLTVTDSIYLDTLGFWFPAQARHITEYKWLSANHGWPVLSIIGQQGGGPGGGSFQLSEVKYLKLDPSGVAENTVGTIKLYPVPAGDNVAIEGKGITEVWLLSPDGKIISHQTVGHNGIDKLNVDLYGLAQGLYIVTVKSGKDVKSFKLPVK